ncbi:MAG TPA: hypothetical protein VI112_01540 [Bacteroidia bacterium]
MKNKIPLLYFFLLPAGLFAQEDFYKDFHETDITVLQWKDPNYLVEISSPDTTLSKYTLNPKRDYVLYAIGLCDQTGKFKWVYNLEGNVESAMILHDTLFVLSGKRDNWKTESKAWLRLLQFSLDGKLLNEKELSKMQLDAPNCWIHGLLDENGHIWSIAEWYGAQEVQIDGLKLPSEKLDHFRLSEWNRSGNTQRSFLLTGKELRLEKKESRSGRIVLLFSGEKCRLGSQPVMDETGIFLFSLTTTDNDPVFKCIGSGHVSAEQLGLSDQGILVAGDFQGNDLLEFEPSSTIGGVKVFAPKNSFRDETARNGFIALLDYNMKMKWLRTMESHCDVMVTSLSAFHDSIVIGICYKDNVVLDNRKIISLKPKTEYEYSDAAVCFLDTAGHLFSYKRAWSEQSEKIRVLLFPQHMVISGEFLYQLKILGRHFKNPSLNSTHFIWYRKR